MIFCIASALVTIHEPHRIGLDIGLILGWVLSFFSTDMHHLELGLDIYKP